MKPETVPAEEIRLLLQQFCPPRYRDSICQMYLVFIAWAPSCPNLSIKKNIGECLHHGQPTTLKRTYSNIIGGVVTDWHPYLTLTHQPRIHPSRILSVYPGHPPAFPLIQYVRLFQNLS